MDWGALAWLYGSFATVMALLTPACFVVVDNYNKEHNPELVTGWPTPHHLVLMQILFGVFWPLAALVLIYKLTHLDE